MEVEVENNTLYRNSKIEVTPSSLHGYGVFANSDISAGEILEECHFIKTYHTGCQFLNEHRFCWPKLHHIEDINERQSAMKHIAFVLGWGAIFNSVKVKGENNADWDTDEVRRLFIFSAVADIVKGEEILTFYGDHYWACHCMGI